MWNIYSISCDGETNNIWTFETNLTIRSRETGTLQLKIKHAFSHDYDVICDVIPEANNFLDLVYNTRQTISFPMSGRSSLYLI